jgi:hypothetical protein
MCSAKTIFSVSERLAGTGGGQDDHGPVVGQLTIELVDALVAPSLDLVEGSTGLLLAFTIGEFVAAVLEPLLVTTVAVLIGAQRRFGVAVAPAGTPA